MRRAELEKDALCLSRSRQGKMGTKVDCSFSALRFRFFKPSTNIIPVEPQVAIYSHDGEWSFTACLCALPRSFKYPTLPNLQSLCQAIWREYVLRVYEIGFHILPPRAYR
jgi:hypothetical protein